MINFFRRFVSFSPYVEVAVRLLYWRVPLIFSTVKALQNFRFRKQNQAKHVASANTNPLRDFSKVLDGMREMGCSSGDILIIHSSMSALKNFGLSPKEVIEELLLFVGPKGTIAAPSIVKYQGEPDDSSRIDFDVSSAVWSYDMREANAWTGAIANAMVKDPRSVRSEHPLNTMVAIGAEADAMMEGNISGELPLPCGPTSSWAYCYRRDAKIVCLGVDVAHSLTMIHVAEDCYVEAWPIRNWYRTRRFNVIADASSVDVSVRERRPKWALHYGERTLARNLLETGVQSEANIEGLYIAVLPASGILNHLNSRKSSGYPYYLWK